MGKKVLKSLITTMGVGLALLVVSIPTFAAGTVSVTADKSATNVSDRVTVTVQTSDPEDAATPPQISITYDTEMLNFESCNVEYGGGGGGLITVTGTSAEIQFTALKEGNASVNAEAIIDEDGNNPATGAAAITVGNGEATPAEGGQGGSADAALRALVVDQGKMVPAFNPDVTQYTVYVDESVTDIKISGGVRNENATITAASGFKNLQPGNNQALITVTAEDGTSLTYNFTIQVGGEMPEVDETEQAAPEEAASTESEKEDTDVPQESEESDAESESSGATAEAGSMELVVDGNTFTISETIDTLVLPAGCSKSSMDYFGTNIETVVFDAGKLTLVYAVSLSDGSGEFFIYDEKKKSFTLFAEIKGANNKFIIPLSAKEKLPSGFEEDNMTWNSCSLPAYSLSKKTAENADVFYLLYAVNQDGDEGFYLYDSEEENYQRFLNYAGKVSTSSKGTGSVMLIGALLIVIVGLIILVINFVIKNRELAGDLEILAQARERRRTEPTAKATPSAPKKVIVPDQDGEGNPVPPAQPKKKTEPKKKLIPKRVLNPGEDDELGLADKANMRTDLPVQTEEEVAPSQASDSTSVKTVKPEKDAVRVAEKEKKAARKLESKAGDETFTSQIVGATDDLSDVADLLNNEENEQFMKTFKSFSTGRINVAYPQTAPSGRSISKPVSQKMAQPEVKDEDALEEMPIQVKEVNKVSKSVEDTMEDTIEDTIEDTVEEIVERKPVSLTREALPDEPDDDFELEFINLDEN